MKKMILILMTVMVFGIGCGSSRTLTYHQWIPRIPTQIHQPAAAQQPTQHLKK